MICYRSNRESKYKDKEFYHNIKSHILEYKMENIIIIGDLNGRIGSKNDNKKYGLPERKSDDKTINNYGHDILTFCNETNLIIANGRFENDDCLGKCTFHCIQNDVVKKSMIDYLIISKSILNILNYFEIGNPVLYTDHSQIKIILRLSSTNKVKILNPTPLFKRIFPYKWTKENCSKFDQKMFDMKCLELSNELKINPMSANEMYRENC